MISVVNINEKLSLFDDHWKPRIVGDVNDCQVKLAKFKGPFTWHSHEHEDEMFLVIKGTLTIKLRERDLTIEEGELCIIPRGVEHMPLAPEEVHVLLVEPKSTLNTGNVISDKTVDKLERI
jgi:mannose-6-phosphate isomerase-like protein (cupin superfamily)